MKKHILNLTLSAMFLAIGLLLPFLTGQIQYIGEMLLPMHIPVLLCGLICGWKYGLAVGFITPLLRSVMFGKPDIYPTATAMMFELAAYGAVAGLLYSLSRRKSVFSLYRSMIIAMLAGRVVWGIARVIIMGFGGLSFSWQLFIAGAFIKAYPGIILQLILIPAIMIALDRAGVVKFSKNKE